MAVSAFMEPPPYLRIEGFLGDELTQRLLSYAQARQADFIPSGVGQERRVDERIRRSLMLSDFGDLQSELQERFAVVLPRAVTELRLSPITLAKLELQLVAHGDGAFYGQHIDTFTGDHDARTERALTGVYYFHRHPKLFTGGDLRLLGFAPDADGTRRFTDISPDHDLFVLFPSWAPHEVRPIACPTGHFMDSRFAINCWFRQLRGGVA